MVLGELVKADGGAAEGTELHAATMIAITASHVRAGGRQPRSRWQRSGGRPLQIFKPTGNSFIRPNRGVFREREGISI